MSSGVEQLKSLGTGGKHKEEKNIPWSQQVDEASCENLSITGDEGFGTAENLQNFQYPPFKDSQFSTGHYKFRKNTNIDVNKKYGRPPNHNFRKEECYSLTWTSSTGKRTLPDYQFSGTKEVRENFKNFDIIENSKLKIHNEKATTIPQPSASQKKTTWALIASQPAKNTSKNAFMSSTQKKKGPGMPPPPMVPGKLNLEETSWELPPKNPLPVSLPPEEERQNNSANIESTHTFDNNRNNLGRTRFSSNDQTKKNWANPHFVNSSTSRRTDNNGEREREKSSEYIRKDICDEDGTIQQKRQTLTLYETNIAVEGKCNKNEISFQTSQAVLHQLRVKNNYNPNDLDIDKASSARFFVIKSYSEDDIHRSIKYEIWCSTDRGNKRLDDAFKERKKDGGSVVLFFSVNRSGHFCGVAQMMSPVDYNSTSSVWSQDKWKGKFKVKWLYVKDVPNFYLRHIKLENNENKSVTNSRDTQEVPNVKGIKVLQIIHSFEHSSSIFDDFHHYEIKQVEDARNSPVNNDYQTEVVAPNGRNYQKLSEDRGEFDREGHGSSKHFINTNNQTFREKNKIGFHHYHDQKSSSDTWRYPIKHEFYKRDKDRITNNLKERERADSNCVHKFRATIHDEKVDNETEGQR